MGLVNDGGWKNGPAQSLTQAVIGRFILNVCLFAPSI